MTTQLKNIRTSESVIDSDDLIRQIDSLDNRLSDMSDVSLKDLPTVISALQKIIAAFSNQNNKKILLRVHISEADVANKKAVYFSQDFMNSGSIIWGD